MNREREPSVEIWLDNTPTATPESLVHSALVVRRCGEHVHQSAQGHTDEVSYHRIALPNLAPVQLPVRMAPLSCLISMSSFLAVVDGRPGSR